MADFTYDLTTSVGQVRLELGDTSYGEGVKPDGSNFTDTEISYFLAQEGNAVGRAVARACEVLARMFSGLVDLSIGPRKESLSQASTAWSDRAKALRKQYGGGTTGAWSAGTIRTDGFSHSKRGDVSTHSGNGSLPLTEYSEGDNDVIYVELD